MHDAYDPQNVFARILRNELPSERVYEDEKTIALGRSASKNGGRPPR